MQHYVKTYLCYTNCGNVFSVRILCSPWVSVLQQCCLRLIRHIHYIFIVQSAVVSSPKSSPPSGSSVRSTALPAAASW